ncbi:hypothetical protein HMPREF1254_1399 [Prevotella sp. BV3P1]|nr:hypothetical protein HMPREF1254_1399 [Prevotella sp. BV3P1]
MQELCYWVEWRVMNHVPNGRFVQKCQFFISKTALKSALEKFQYRKNR